VADTKRRLQFVVGGEIAKNGRKYRVLSRNRAWRESRYSVLPFQLCENTLLMTHIKVGWGGEHLMERSCDSTFAPRTAAIRDLIAPPHPRTPRPRILISALMTTTVAFWHYCIVHVYCLWHCARSSSRFKKISVLRSPDCLNVVDVIPIEWRQSCFKTCK
jgi:hypothetical protein